MKALFNPSAVLDAATRTIAAAYPALLPFLNEGILQEQFTCLLQHVSTLLTGGEIAREEEERCRALARKLACRAAAMRVEIEDLMRCTYLFRHTLWNHLQEHDGIITSLPPGDLLRAATRINEHLSGVNLVLMHEYLERERETVRDQRERISADLELARRIQQSMFPASCSIGACKLCAEIIPSGAVGGDFYGTIPFGNPATRADLYIGDVQGKGVAAALIMMLMTSVLWGAASPGKTPRQIVSEANRRFREHMTNELSQFVSLFYLSYDITSRKIAYTKAGHEEGLFVRGRDRKLITLSTSGYFLGIFDDAEYEEKTMPVEEGDRLYLFTDGITLLGNPDGKRFEYRDLYDIIMRYNALPIGETLEEITRELMSRHGSRDLKDDVGLMVVEF